MTFKASPETTQGQTSVSSSINTSYSVQAGFFGNTPTGGVSGSQSFGHTQSFSTQDVETIYNRQGNEASWTFRLEPHSNLSHSTFQPFLQALWKSDESYVEANNNTIPFCIKFSSRGKIMLKEHIMSKSEFDKYKNEKPSFWEMLGNGLATTRGGFNPAGLPKAMIDLGESLKKYYHNIPTWNFSINDEWLYGTSEKGINLGGYENRQNNIFNVKI